MNIQNYTIKLTSRLLENIGNKDFLLSSIIIEAKRVAKLRGDYLNLWWLEWETCNIKEKAKLQSIPSEIKNKFVDDEIENLSREYWSKWVDERQFPEFDKHHKIISSDNILPRSIQELEIELQNLIQKSNNLIDTSGMHPVDKYFSEESNSKSRLLLLSYEEAYSKILGRIRIRVHEFLSQTEYEIISGKILSSFFDENKSYVEKELIKLSEKFIDHFKELENRLSDGTPDSFSQALLIVRIILKDYADIVYPTPSGEVMCSDGKKRTLTDDKYISRIWQYIFETIEKESSSVDLLESQLDDLGNRIDKIYSKSCKGIHAEVNSFETYQCIIQLYVSLGDILRLTK